MGNTLEGLPIIKDIVNMFPSVDYEGQRLAERVYQLVLILFAVVGFGWGYLCQQFVQTIYILGAGVALACLLVIPPWPFYRKNALVWQKKVGDQKSSTSSSSLGKKKDKPKSS